MVNKIRVGIIGTGYTVGIARAHMKAYEANNRVELTALYDIVPGRAGEWKEKNCLSPEVNVCNSLQELFSMVDAVSICTPNNTHIDLTTKAIEEGKHVLCEKPLAISFEETKRAIEYAKEYPGIIAMVGFHCRNIPAIKYFKKIIDDGILGKIYTYRQEWGGNRIADPLGVKLEWRMQQQLSGDGALVDFGSHMLDIADYLLSGSQGKICEVNAIMNTFITERLTMDEGLKGLVTNDDCAVFNAKMQSGTLLSFVTSRLGVPRNMIEIVGEGGMLIFNGIDDQIEVMFKDKERGYGNASKEVIAVEDIFKGGEGHKGLINEFVCAIMDGKPFERSLERGAYIQYLLDMTKKAADEGRTIKFGKYREYLKDSM